MTPGPASDPRRYGQVFDELAAEYDRHRPADPDELVDQACRVAGIGSGDRVLEVGCGTGQLTRSLLARGLHVTALEPGANLIALAKQNLAGAVDSHDVVLHPALAGPASGPLRRTRGHLRAIRTADPRQLRRDPRHGPAA
jgi:SAM-dependent methyltransferase